MKSKICAGPATEFYLVPVTLWEKRREENEPHNFRDSCTNHGVGCLKSSTLSISQFWLSQSADHLGFQLLQNFSLDHTNLARFQWLR